MNTRFIFNRFRQSRNARIYLLELLWILSLTAGIALSVVFSGAFKFCGFEGYLYRPTVFSLLVVSCLPVLFAIFSLYYRFDFIGVILVILWGISRGFCGMMIYYAFGSGAWLFRPFLLFSAGLGSTIMWWLFFRHGTNTTSCFFKNVCLAVFLALSAAVVDILVISPFLTCLSIYV